MRAMGKVGAMALAGLAMVAGASLASAGTFQLMFTGDRHDAAYTGWSTGNDKAMIGGGGVGYIEDDWGMTRLTIWEANDTPVFVDTTWYQMKTGGGHRGPGYPGATRYGKTHTLELPEGEYLSAIQVCTNDKGDKSEVKGVRMWGTRYTNDGRPTVSSTAKSFEQANCKTWTTKSECPKGEVAISLDVAHADKKFIQGFRLACRAVKPY